MNDTMAKKQKTKDDEFMTVQETADKLRVKPVTIYRMARAGTIPARKFGKTWRISRTKLAEMFDDNRKYN